MTQPSTPGGVIQRAASRLAAQREATRALAEEIQAQRQGDASTPSVPRQEGTP